MGSLYFYKLFSRIQRHSQVLSCIQFTIRELKCENIGSGKRGEPETAPLLIADGRISVVTLSAERTIIEPSVYC